MKIRLRAVGAPRGSTVSVELGDSATLGDLRLRASEATALASQELKLSLNKKSQLEGADDASLDSLGLCHSDLLWILPESGSPAQERVQADPSSGLQQISPQMASSSSQVATESSPKPHNDGSTHPDAKAAEPVLPSEQHEQRQAEEAMEVDDARGQDQGPADGETAMEATDEQPCPGEESADECQAAIEAAASTAPLLPGHLLRVLSKNDLSGHLQPSQRLVLMAIHAVFLETGFLLPNNDKDGSLELPDSTFSSGISSVLSIDYALPGPNEQKKVSTMAAEAICRLRCSLMGRHLVAYGSSTTEAAAARTVTLDCSTYVAAASEGAQGSRTGPELCPRALRGLWTAVKDGLASPLLSEACRSKGLPAPLGLSTLPAELRDTVLGNLPARSLVALMCTCHEFKHSAASGDLWRPLFQADFQGLSPAPGTSSTSASVNWLAAYAARVQQRKRQEALRRYYRQAHQRHHYPPQRRPGQIPMPGNPFMPSMPMGPQMVTGGDFDRLPAPLLGQPSMMMPSMGFPGGAGGGGIGGAFGPRGLGSGFPSRRGSSTRTLPHL